MNKIDIPKLFWSSPNNSNKDFSTVTSRAVVGSSAISNLGSFAKAIAIIALCLCPPDSS